MTAAQQTDLARCLAEQREALAHMRRKPLAIDLFCGLGGWSEALLAEAWDVIGFDIERHQYEVPVRVNGIEVGRPMARYPAQLVLQDVRTLHGAQFRDADLIVASPPCQFFSRMAMPFKCPWKQEEFERRRNLAHELFWQCWRIQHEASEAKGEYIPMIVENVVGAQKWVGRSRFAYGSFHLWGDVPALMPLRTARNGRKLPESHDTFAKNGKPCNKLTDARYGSDGNKFGGEWWNDSTNNLIRKASSRSSARKAASAMIAKIPPALASHIAKVFKPQSDDRAARLWLNDQVAEEVLIRLEAQG